MHPYVAFQDQVSRERVLLGPLSEAGFASFAREKDAGEIYDGLVRLQRELAIKIVCIVTRGLRFLPADVRRCVFSFAFTRRSFPRLLQVPGILGMPRVSFRVTYQAGRVPVRGTWVASVPLDATLNDVCKLIQVRLWEYCKRQPFGGLYYDDNDDALSTIVFLESIPFFRRDYGPGNLPLYFYQAYHFQRFVGHLPRRNGRIHVEALVLSREFVKEYGPPGFFLLRSSTTTIDEHSS